jgi:transposase
MSNYTKLVNSVTARVVLSSRRRDLRTSIWMARPYSDDLRRRILQAYEQGEGTELQLARRFRVSLGYVQKIRRQQRRTGRMERIPHRPGRKPKFSEAIRERLRGWLQQQPDLTLGELQEKLHQQKQLRVSVPALWVVLRKMGLRLKKSRSTPVSGTRKPTGSGDKRSWKNSARSLRRS